MVGWAPLRGEAGAATLRLGFGVGDVCWEGRRKVAEVVVESGMDSAGEAGSGVSDGAMVAEDTDSEENQTEDVEEEGRGRVV